MNPGKKLLARSEVLLPGAFQRQHFRVVALKGVAMRPATRKMVPELQIVTQRVSERFE